MPNHINLTANFILNAVQWKYRTCAFVRELGYSSDINERDNYRRIDALLIDSPQRTHIEVNQDE